MAEAFFKKYSSKKFHVLSAGTTPSSKLNPLVLKVMEEIHINMKNQQPKLLSNSMIKESCPSLFVKDVLDWNISDPKEKSIEEIRIIRDKIKSEVLNLVKSLEESN